MTMKNLSIQKDTENLFIGDYHIKEYENKIFLNGAYIGIANARDSVILIKGSLLIKKAL
jgi:hypothetical protein